MTETIDPAPNQTPIVDEGPEPAIRAGWLRAVLFVICFGAISLLLGVIVMIVLKLSGADVSGLENATGSPLAMLAMVVQSLIVIGLVVLFRKYIDNQTIMSLGLEFNREYRRDLLSGALVGILAISSIFLILLVTGGVKIVDVRFPLYTILSMILVFALAAFTEELVCRGYLLLNSMQSMNRWLALVFSSVLFSLFHVLNPNPSLIGLLNIIAAGVLLGVYYVHKRNLWFPIGLHITWNYFQGVVFGGAVSGNETESILVLSISGNEYLTGGNFGFEASLVATGVTLLAAFLIHLKYRKDNGLRNLPNVR